MVVDIVDLVYGHKFALVEFHVASPVPVQERLCHADNDVTVGMAVVVEFTDLELELLDVLALPEIVEVIEVVGELRLQEDVLDYYDSLGPEDLVLNQFASAE